MPISATVAVSEASTMGPFTSNLNFTEKELSTFTSEFTTSLMLLHEICKIFSQQKIILKPSKLSEE